MVFQPSEIRLTILTQVESGGFWENVLDNFSCFYTEIAYSYYCKFFGRMCWFCRHFAKLCGALGFWKNVLNSFSCFYTEIAYSHLL